MRRVAELEEIIENRLEKEQVRLRGKGIYTALSPVFKTREEVLKGSPLFLDMVDSAKILFDGDDFRIYLEGLRKKMKKLGSRRVKRLRRKIPLPQSLYSAHCAKGRQHTVKMHSYATESPF